MHCQNTKNNNNMLNVYYVSGIARNFIYIYLYISCPSLIFKFSFLILEIEVFSSEVK